MLAQLDRKRLHRTHAKKLGTIDIAGSKTPKQPHNGKEPMDDGHAMESPATQAGIPTDATPHSRCYAAAQAHLFLVTVRRFVDLSHTNNNSAVWQTPLTLIPEP